MLVAVAAGRGASAGPIATAYSVDILSDINLAARFPNNQPLLRGNTTTAADLASLDSVNKGKLVTFQNPTDPRTAAVGPGAGAVPKAGQPKQFKLFDPHLAEGDAQIVPDKNNALNFPTALKNQGLVNLDKPDVGTGGGSDVLQTTFQLKMADKLTLSFNADALLYVFLAKGAVNASATASYMVDITILQNPNTAFSKEVFHWAPDGKKTGITGGKVNADPFSLNDELSIAKPGKEGRPQKGTSTFFSATTGLLAGGPNNSYLLDIHLSEGAAAGAANFVKPKDSPEPATLALAALGLPGVVLANRRRRAD
jgi:hypothetical protein